jgi:GTPase SAR1 family protein
VISKDRPRDLSDQIRGWLAASLSLAQSAGVQEIATEMKKVAARQEIPGFQLSFVGEFSRGKSSLINRLLNRPLLPIGALPTTATLTSIVAGAEECMEVVFFDGHQEVRALTEDSWHDLIASDQPEPASKVVAQVRLTVDNTWLRELDAEVIDTPGINDLSNYRAALVTETLSQSDAAVMLVSAVFPLSLTEAAFLEQEVIRRHIPRIMAVVSMLDTLPQNQKAEVFKSAIERVAHVSPHIRVYPTYPVNGDTTEEEALEDVRLQIAALFSRSDRRAWRSQQVASLLADYLGQLIRAGQTALEAAKMSAPTRAEALLKASQQTHMAELQWEKISQDFDVRRLLLDSLLREQLVKAQYTLIEQAAADLDKAPDPKLWWERDFPLRIRQAFFQLAHDYEAWLLDCLAREVEWLQEEVRRVFDINIGMSTFASSKATEVPLNVGEVELTDIEKQRFFVRLGTSAAVIIGYLLFAPIGSAVTVLNNILQLGETVIGNEAVNLAASPLFDNKVKRQRLRLRGEIKRTVERGIEEYITRISTRLNDLFQEVINGLKREQTVWLRSHKQMLEASGQSSTNLPWQQLLEEATRLRTEILAALAQ